MKEFITDSSGDSTGHLTLSGSNPGTVPCSLNGTSWGASGNGYWYYSSGSAIAQGKITATFTWQPDYIGEPPPASVIVTENSTASWSLAGSGTNTACDDGFGDAQTVTGHSGTSTGTRYSVVQNPGNSFPVTCTPSIKVSGSGYPNYGYAGISVAYSADATPVTIEIDGLTNDTNVLIGQKLTAHLNTEGFLQSDWQWTINGADPFAGFQVTATTGQALELTPAMEQQASFFWYYRSLGGARGSIPSTVSCTATITDPNGVQWGVLATQTITVYEPQNVDFQAIAGPVTVDKFIDDDDPLKTVLWKLQPFNDDTGKGIQWKGKATTPSQFVGENGSGQWSFAQTITATMWYYDLTGSIHEFPQNGLTGLDKQFTYAGLSFFATSAPGTAGDKPFKTLTNSMTTAFLGAIATTYMIYMPPDANGVSGTTWVPLQVCHWNFQGTAQLVQLNPLTWTLTNGDGLTADKPTWTTSLPSWTEVITATDF